MQLRASDTIRQFGLDTGKVHAYYSIELKYKKRLLFHWHLATTYIHLLKTSFHVTYFEARDHANCCVVLSLFHNSLYVTYLEA